MSKFSDLNNVEHQERNYGLQKLEKILSELNIKSFLEGGAYLGAYRDKNFISWDWDVELAVFSETTYHRIGEILQKLEKNKFNIIYFNSSFKDFKINCSINEHTKYSIIGYSLNGKYRERSYLRYPSIFFSNNEKIFFLGKEYNCVHHDYLEWTYKNWKVPTKSARQKEYFNSHVFVKRNLLFLLFSKFSTMLLTFIFILNKILNRFKNREALFQYVIKYYAKKINFFIDVGSNDGCESIIAQKLNKKTKIIIFEIDKKNISNIKKNLTKNNINLNNIFFYDSIVSNINGLKKFYFNKNRPNLNSIIHKPNQLIKNVKSTTLDSFFNKFQKLKQKDFIFIKADIEGGEFELLNGSLNFIKLHKNITFLFELHQETYDEGDRNIKKIIKMLLDNKFHISFVESAGVPQPEIFKKYKYEPFKISNNRGLYKNISSEFVLNYAFERIYFVQQPSFLNNKAILHKKIIRSICISRTLDL